MHLEREVDMSLAKLRKTFQTFDADGPATCCAAKCFESTWLADSGDYIGVRKIDDYSCDVWNASNGFLVVSGAISQAIHGLM